MNAITQVQHLSPQTAIPAAIHKASKIIDRAPEGTLVGKVNVRRKIYDTFIEANGQLLTSEITDHLKTFGYSHGTITATIGKMHAEGMLTRSIKIPYAYGLVKGCPVPPNDPMKVKVPAKQVQGTPVQEVQQIQELQQLPPAENLTLALSSLSNSVTKLSVSTQLFSETDLDLIINHLTQMRNHCIKAASMRDNVEEMYKDIASEYSLAGSDLNAILIHLVDLKKSLRKISQMAKFIRSTRH